MQILVRAVIYCRIFAMHANNTQELASSWPFLVQRKKKDDFLTRPEV